MKAIRSRAGLYLFRQFGDGGGEAVQFVDHEGRIRVPHRDVFVTDAMGHAVPARLSLQAAEVAQVAMPHHALSKYQTKPLASQEQGKNKDAMVCGPARIP